FANLSVLVDRLAEETGDVSLVCAGTDGKITLEDAVAAGAIAERLLNRVEDISIGNDEATIALGLHMTYGDEQTRHDALRSGFGGANLIALGSDADITFAARVDSCPVLPVYRDGSLVVEAARDAADDGEWSI